MTSRTYGIIALLLLAPAAATAADALTSLHPEDALPNPTEQGSPDPYTGFISRVQEELHLQGFDAGPVNGDFGSKTQAALAQFQLSRIIPASGQLDDQTLAELRITRDEPQATAGATAEPSAAPEPPATGARDPATEVSPVGSSPESTAEPKPPGQTMQPREPETGEK